MRRAVLVAAAAAVVWAGCSGDAQDRLRRAREAVFEKKPEQALAQYRQALDLIERDDSAESRVLHARALKGAADVYHLELRDYVRAVEVYRELIRVCPEAPETLEARIQLATLLHTQFRDARGAISVLTTAIERNAPQSAELTYTVARLYFELGDYLQASIEAKRVQQKFETSPYVDDALLLESQALAMMEGRAQDALRALGDLAERFPDSPLVPFALFEMGKMKADAGEREAAIAVWVRALQRHPDPGMVQEAIGRVRRQIEERTPSQVGKAAAAFDHHLIARPARTSIEAAGGTAAEAARETGD